MLCLAQREYALRSVSLKVVCVRPLRTTPSGLARSRPSGPVHVPGHLSGLGLGLVLRPAGTWCLPACFPSGVGTLVIDGAVLGSCFPVCSPRRAVRRSCFAIRLSPPGAPEVCRPYLALASGSIRASCTRVPLNATVRVVTLEHILDVIDSSSSDSMASRTFAPGFVVRLVSNSEIGMVSI